jgi:photosystem II stability/assembly factor-like uncharacterized protein
MKKMALAGLLVLVAASAVAWGQAAPAPAAGDWVNVTNNVGGAKWGEYGMHMLVAVPGKDADEVIAGISGSGLWSSVDGGAKWEKMGGEGKTQITARPTSVVWDPKDGKTFWVTAIYGSGLFKTTDGGKTFQELAKLNAIDSVSVDFADPERKLVLVCHHESARSLEKSVDGGKTFVNIGKNLPEKTNHTTNTVIIDAKTYLVNCAGWLQGTTSGIYRTEDGGDTWTKVYDKGPGGRPLVAADGTIFWLQLYGGLLKSTDQGKTWSGVGGPVKSNVVATPAGSVLGGKDGGLMGWSDKGIYASQDGGKTWKTVVAKMPVKSPTSVAYDAKRNSVFVSNLQAKQNADAIWRLDLAKE